MTLEDRLTAGPESDYRRTQKAAHPSGWEPGIAWNGTDGAITTGPMAEPPHTWDDLILDWGLDPAEVMVVGDPHIRAWETNVGDGVIKKLRYYRMSIRRRSATIDVDELMALVTKWRPSKVQAPTGDFAYVVSSGDLQLGKPDGDGTEGTVNRFLAKTDAAVRRLKELRRMGRPIGPVYLPWLGDCIEGVNSQGGRLVMRLELTVTEQIRLYRRLMLHQIKTFAPLAERLIVPVVPGNHDEAQRIGDKMATRSDDSWAIEGASAVADAVALNADVFGHVSFVFPGYDELTITLDMGGTTVGMAHGHQWRTGKAVDWWASQSHGQQTIGDAEVLLSAHRHHFQIIQTGSKLHVQTPALDGGSTWFRHRTGEDSPAGMVTMVMGADHNPLGDIAVL